MMTANNAEVISFCVKPKTKGPRSLAGNPNSLFSNCNNNSNCKLNWLFAH